MQISLVLLIATVLVRLSYEDDFGCGCGYYENTKEEADKCMAEKLKESGIVKEGEEGRIVNGYSVGKACNKRPFLVQVRSCCLPGRGEGNCMGSIINKKYVVTAAHCFCFGGNGIFECIENNGKKTDKKTEYGHYIFEEGSVKSSMDDKYAKNVTIIIVGKAREYAHRDLNEIYDNIPHEDLTAKRTATRIIIHPDYVGPKMEQNDIALIEVDRPFDFSDPKEVAPICLSHSIDEVENKEALITGFGRVAEEREGTLDKAKCYTGYGGPSQFEECRPFYWDGGEVTPRREGSCLNNKAPPWTDADCKEYFEKQPEMREMKSILELDGGTKKTCHPVEREDKKMLLWCATCVKGKGKGEDGYCDPSKTDYDEYTDVEYDSYIDSGRKDVSFDLGWGYCQPTCTTSSMEEMLQEAEIFVLKKEECVEKTKHYLAKDGMEYWAIMPERELCAASKYDETTLHVKKEKDGYTVISNSTETLWGDKDSCQGDSGGPLWQIRGKKAYLSGVINRGDGCSRKDTFPIYARISFHKDWILKNAEAGSCSANKSNNNNKNSRSAEVQESVFDNPNNKFYYFAYRKAGKRRKRNAPEEKEEIMAKERGKEIGKEERGRELREEERGKDVGEEDINAFVKPL